MHTVIISCESSSINMARFSVMPVQMMVDITAQDYDPAALATLPHGNCKKHDDVMSTICVGVCVCYEFSTRL